MQRENESAKQSRKELAGGGAAALYRFCYLETVPAEPRRIELQSIRNERSPLQWGDGSPHPWCSSGWGLDATFAARSTCERPPCPSSCTCILRRWLCL